MSSADTKIGAAAEARERAEDIAKRILAKVYTEPHTSKRETPEECEVCIRMVAEEIEQSRSTPAEAGQPALRSSSPEVVTVPAICPDCGFLNVHNCRTDSPLAKRGKVGSKEPQ